MRRTSTEVDGPVHFLNSDVAQKQEISQRALVFDEANPGAYAAAVRANAAQQFMTGATALKVRQLEMLKHLVAPSACPRDPPDPIVLHVSCSTSRGGHGLSGRVRSPARVARRRCCALLWTATWSFCRRRGTCVFFYIFYLYLFFS